MPDRTINPSAQQIRANWQRCDCPASESADRAVFSTDMGEETTSRPGAAESTDGVDARLPMQPQCQAVDFRRNIGNSIDPEGQDQWFPKTFRHSPGIAEVSDGELCQVFIQTVPNRQARTPAIEGTSAQMPSRVARVTGLLDAAKIRDCKFRPTDAQALSSAAVSPAGRNCNYGCLTGSLSNGLRP